MKKLVLAAVAASVMMPAMASAWSDDVAVQPLEVCASKHSSQEDRDECVIQHIRDLHVIIDFEERQKNEALAELDTVVDVISGYNSRDAERFAKDSAGFIDDFYTWVIARLDDLKRAEDRVRYLESKIKKNNNPLDWNNW